MIYNDAQKKEIANKIEQKPELSNWKDWGWQLKHSIKSLEKFEYLTGIKFEVKEKSDLGIPFDKFPLSITSYYLSFIDNDNYQNDTVFKQAFGGIVDLTTLNPEHIDPLSEEHDSPIEGIDYTYSGTLIKNTNIVGNIESMNVYYKHL